MTCWHPGTAALPETETVGGGTRVPATCGR